MRLCTCALTYAVGVQELMTRKKGAKDQSKRKRKPASTKEKQSRADTIQVNRRRAGLGAGKDMLHYVQVRPLLGSLTAARMLRLPKLLPIRPPIRLQRPQNTRLPPVLDPRL